MHHLSWLSASLNFLFSFTAAVELQLEIQSTHNFSNKNQDLHSLSSFPLLLWRSVSSCSLWKYYLSEYIKMICDINTFVYLKWMESLRLEEFLLVKLQPGYLEILSEINDLLTSVQKCPFRCWFFLSPSNYLRKELSKAKAQSLYQCLHTHCVYIWYRIP